jgi:uncharacterized protein YpmB
MKKHNGFGVVIILVIVLVVSAVGFVGYRIYNNNATSTDSSEVTTNSEQKDISSANDVTTTQNELDNINIDDDLDPSALDADINDLQ